MTMQSKINAFIQALLIFVRKTRQFIRYYFRCSFNQQPKIEKRKELNKKSVAIRINCNAFYCDRDRIQTCNRLIRSQLLYSVELRGPRY